jgi:hypothetical protein
MEILKDVLIIFGALAAYFAIRVWLFPRLGIRT